MHSCTAPRHLLEPSTRYRHQHTCLLPRQCSGPAGVGHTHECVLPRQCSGPAGVHTHACVLPRQCVGREEHTHLLCVSAVPSGRRDMVGRWCIYRAGSNSAGRVPTRRCGGRPFSPAGPAAASDPRNYGRVSPEQAKRLPLMAPPTGAHFLYLAGLPPRRPPSTQSRPRKA